MMVRVLRALLPLLLLFAGQGAAAKVMVTFYSHEFGNQFPHAFIVTKGTVDATGEKVDYNYGFTVINVSPAILFGAVKGRMDYAEPSYVKSSHPHFSVELDDVRYAQLLRFVTQWGAEKQPNYSVERRNCVHFVMEAAASIGLNVNRQSKFFKKPTSFTKELKALNPSVLPPQS